MYLYFCDKKVNKVRYYKVWIGMGGGGPGRPRRGRTRFESFSDKFVFFSKFWYFAILSLKNKFENNVELRTISPRISIELCSPSLLVRNLENRRKNSNFRFEPVKQLRQRRDMNAHRSFKAQTTVRYFSSSKKSLLFSKKKCLSIFFFHSFTIDQIDVSFRWYVVFAHYNNHMELNKKLLL